MSRILPSNRLSRRLFLQSGSALIALPFFESLAPRAFAQQSAPVRLMFMYFPHGALRNSWRPTGLGTDFTLPDQLSSLAAHKSELTFPIRLRNAPVGLDGAGHHARASGCFLTCTRINKSTQNIQAGRSIDRAIAEAINGTASPKWLVTTPPGNGYADSGDYSTSYSSNISWIYATTPASRLTDTRVVFDTLFPGGGTLQPTEEQKLARYRKSILDNAHAEATTIANAMSTSDKQKLDQFLTSVREVEKGITAAAVQNAPTCSPGANPGSTGSDFARFTRTMIDLHILGMQCGRTQVSTHYMDFEGSGRSGINGVSGGHHDISHYKDNSTYPEKYRLITKWYGDQLGYVVNKLKQTPSETAGKSMLDVAILVYGSDLHDTGSDSHGINDLPIVVAGRGNGAINPGRVIETIAPLANLWVSLAQKLGVNLTSLGDSTGSLSGF